MILDNRGHELYELADLALLWGPDFAMHVWDIVVIGHPSWLGLNKSTDHVERIPAGTATTGYDSLVPASTWPEILSAAVRIADKEGIA